MKQIIVIVLLTALSVVNIMAQNRQKAIYIVDGVQVEDYDGSQLVGKTIQSYKVDKEYDIHIIFTTDYKKGSDARQVEVKKIVDGIKDNGGDIVVESNNDPQVTIVHFGDKGGKMDDESTIFIVDGKEATRAALDSIGPDAINSIDIVKKQSDERFKKYAKEGTLAVIIVTTKK